MKLLLTFLLFTSALGAQAVAKLDCGPEAAQKLLDAMPDMGATSYAPERYSFLRSTCGSAENGPYCLGRNTDNTLKEPVYDELAESYAEGLRLCGVTANQQGRLQTGEIRCRPDPQPTCRIFAPDASNHANWGSSPVGVADQTSRPEVVTAPEEEGAEAAPARPSRLQRAGQVAGQGARVVGRGIVQGGRVIGRGIVSTGRWIGRQSQRRGSQNEDARGEDEDEGAGENEDGDEDENEDEEESAEQPEEDWGEGW
jgi:hypothetical protein